MKCLQCEKELERLPGVIIPFTKAAKYCNKLCKSRRGYELRKIRMSKLDDKICQNKGCSKAIVSGNTNTKTCSIICGRALRELSKGVSFNNNDGPNSSSNELIRMINKFLLVKTGERYGI